MPCPAEPIIVLRPASLLYLFVCCESSIWSTAQLDRSTLARFEKPGGGRGRRAVSSIAPRLGASPASPLRPRTHHGTETLVPQAVENSVQLPIILHRYSGHRRRPCGRPTSSWRSWHCAPSSAQPWQTRPAVRCFLMPLVPRLQPHPLVPSRFLLTLLIFLCTFFRFLCCWSSPSPPRPKLIRTPPISDLFVAAPPVGVDTVTCGGSSNPCASISVRLSPNYSLVAHVLRRPPSRLPSPGPVIP